VSEDLQPLAPREAMEMWLDRQRSERAEETVKSYYYRIKQFVEWCEERDIDNLNGLSTRDIFDFDSKCRAEDLSQSTLNNRLGTLRLFLAFCVDYNAVSESVRNAVDIPELVKSHRVNEEKLAATRAEEILDTLDTYRYGSREHALFALAWHTTMRLGTLRSLDVGDCFLEEADLDRLRHYPEIDDAEFEEIVAEVQTPFVYVRHRDETPLKNNRDGQRPIALKEKFADILRAYINVNRVETRDEADRPPLFTTEKGSGRMSKAAIRRVFNIVTQPCRFGGECPHGRDTDSCEALKHGLEARCPSSRSPHPVRTGSITDHRDRGWPPEALAERANATPEVIREHYDHPQLLRRMESRRHYLDDTQEDDSDA